MAAPALGQAPARELAGARNPAMGLQDIGGNGAVVGQAGQAPGARQGGAGAQGLDGLAASVAGIARSLDGAAEEYEAALVRRLETRMREHPEWELKDETADARARAAALFTAKRVAKERIGALSAHVRWLVEEAQRLLEDGASPALVEAVERLHAKSGAFTNPNPRSETFQNIFDDAWAKGWADAEKARTRDGFSGPNLGYGTQDTAAAKEGDLHTVALDGTTELDARGKEQSQNTASQSGIKSDATNTLMGGDLGKEYKEFVQGDAFGQVGWAKEAAKTLESLGFGTLGLKGLSIDGSGIKAKFFKVPIVSPYPPLAKFATPVSIMPGFGVTFEALVSAGVSISGDLSIQRASGGSSDAAKQRGALQQIDAEIAQHTAAAEAAQGDAAARARVKAEEARARREKLAASAMAENESRWDIDVTGAADASVTGEIFAGVFGGMPLLNVGLGIAASLTAKGHGDLTIGLEHTRKAGKNTTKTKSAAVGLLAKVDADLSLKGKYQLLFASGDIFSVSFADWTLGMMEFKGHAEMNPLKFRKDSFDHYFGLMGSPKLAKAVHEKKGKTEAYRDQIAASGVRDEFLRSSAPLAPGEDGAPSAAQDLRSTTGQLRAAREEQTQAASAERRAQTKTQYFEQQRSKAETRRDEAQASGNESASFEYGAMKASHEHHSGPARPGDKFRMAGRAVASAAPQYKTARKQGERATGLAQQEQTSRGELALASQDAAAKAEEVRRHDERLGVLVTSARSHVQAVEGSRSQLFEIRLQSTGLKHKAKKAVGRSTHRSLLDTATRKATQWRVLAEKRVAQVNELAGPKLAEIEAEKADLTRSRDGVRRIIDHLRTVHGAGSKLDRYAELQASITADRTELAKLREQLTAEKAAESSDAEIVATLEARIKATHDRKQASKKEAATLRGGVGRRDGSISVWRGFQTRLEGLVAKIDDLEKGTWAWKRMQVEAEEELAEARQVEAECTADAAALGDRLAHVQAAEEAIGEAQTARQRLQQGAIGL